MNINKWTLLKIAYKMAENTFSNRKVIREYWEPTIQYVAVDYRDGFYDPNRPDRYLLQLELS